MEALMSFYSSLIFCRIVLNLLSAPSDWSVIVRFSESSWNWMQQGRDTRSRAKEEIKWLSYKARQPQEPPFFRVPTQMGKTADSFFLISVN